MRYRRLVCSLVVVAVLSACGTSQSDEWAVEAEVWHDHLRAAQLEGGEVWAQYLAPNLAWDPTPLYARVAGHPTVGEVAVAFAMQTLGPETLVLEPEIFISVDGLVDFWFYDWAPIGADDSSFTKDPAHGVSLMAPIGPSGAESFINAMAIEDWRDRRADWPQADVAEAVAHRWTAVWSGSTDDIDGVYRDDALVRDTIAGFELAGRAAIADLAAAGGEWEINAVGPDAVRGVYPLVREVSGALENSAKRAGTGRNHPAAIAVVPTLPSERSIVGALVPQARCLNVGSVGALLVGSRRHHRRERRRIVRGDIRRDRVVGAAHLPEERCHAVDRAHDFRLRRQPLPSTFWSWQGRPAAEHRCYDPVGPAGRQQRPMCGSHRETPHERTRDLFGVEHGHDVGHDEIAVVVGWVEAARDHRRTHVRCLTAAISSAERHVGGKHDRSRDGTTELRRDPHRQPHRSQGSVGRSNRFGGRHTVRVDMPYVRPFEERERQAVIDLWRGADLIRRWNDPDRDIERKLAVDDGMFLVAALDGAVAGTVMAGYDGHRGWINYLAVETTRRGTGIAPR